MEEDENISFSTDILDKIQAMVKDKLPELRVGIMGESLARSISPGAKNTPTNAQIGAAHEFGAPARNIPRRSFLRMPIAMKLPGALAAANILESDALKEAIAAGDVTPIMKKIGVMAEGIIQDAFDTGGFGQWPATQQPNNTGMTLVDTTQLRRSITSKVVK